MNLKKCFVPNYSNGDGGVLTMNFQRDLKSSIVRLASKESEFNPLYHQLTKGTEFLVFLIMKVT